MRIFAVSKYSGFKTAFEMIGIKFDRHSNLKGFIALSYVCTHRFVSQWSLRDTPTCVTYHATADLFCSCSAHAPRNAVATQIGNINWCVRPRTNGNVFLRFCIVSCNELVVLNSLEDSKQYKNAGKRFCVYGANACLWMCTIVELTQDLISTDGGRDRCINFKNCTVTCFTRLLFRGNSFLMMWFDSSLRNCDRSFNAK